MKVKDFTGTSYEGRTGLTIGKMGEGPHEGRSGLTIGKMGRGGGGSRRRRIVGGTWKCYWKGRRSTEEEG